jgi:hypothetical protein
MSNGTNCSTDSTLVMFFVELEVIQIGFITDHTFARGTYKVCANFLSCLDTSLDNFHHITRERPDTTACSAFTHILGEPLCVQVNFHMLSTLTQRTFHCLFSF